MKVKKKYIVVAPSYNENNGGAVVQHKLCSILNELGYECHLHPFQTRFYEIEKSNFKITVRSLFGFARRILIGLYKERDAYKNFKTNPAFNTPIIKNREVIFDNDWVVIYPEITFGNPLKAKNVVRWLLHNPGFHTGNIFYNRGDILVKFNSAISDFRCTGISILRNELKVIHYPLEHYNLNNLPKVREGTAYCLRKGHDKNIVHDLSDSILIDGMSHAEIAAIFKRVKTFISYDTYTAYSFFAVLCGCDSIVVPDDGVSKEEWYPNPRDRYGLSYGLDDLDEARRTKHLVKEYVSKEEGKSMDRVRDFILESDAFWGEVND